CSADRGLRTALLPRPAVAEPQRGQHMQLSGLGPRIADADANADVARRRLRVIRRNLPITILVEDAGVEEFELALCFAALGVLCPEARVGELCLRIVVAPAQPRGGRRPIDIPPVLLGVLAVIALVPGQTEDALLQDRVAPVPERQREAHAL